MLEFLLLIIDKSISSHPYILHNVAFFIAILYNYTMVSTGSAFYIKLQQERGILGLCLRTVFKVEALSRKLRAFKLESDLLKIIKEN